MNILQHCTMTDIFLSFFVLCLRLDRKSTIMQRFENNASERIIPPKREGYSAERMQVVHENSD